MSTQHGVRHLLKRERCLTPLTAAGQSMVEYLLIATAVIAALLFIKPGIQDAVNSLFTSAKDKANEAAGSLGSVPLP